MMDTMTTDKKRMRRNHTPVLKAQILQECAAPDSSGAKVAMAHGINANIVHGWRKQAREQGAAPVFMPLAIEAPPGADDRLHVELRRGALTTTTTTAWPLSAVGEMARWMRELLR